MNTNPDPAAARVPHRHRPLFGAGLIMAATGIGASDIVAATVAGAMDGDALLWALVLGAFFKYVLCEGLARWQLSSGTTILEGWSQHLPRGVLLLFAAYLVVWSIAVSGALISGCGMAVETATHGAVPRTWGALAHAVLAFAYIAATHAGRLARVMKPLIAAMFVSVVACAAFTVRDPLLVLRGLLVPALPAGGAAYVLSLIGGVGGSLTLLSYGYLLRDPAGATPRTLRTVRADLAVAYAFTALFAAAVMLVASRVFHAHGVTITDRDAVSRMAEHLATLAGPLGYVVYAFGFWAAVVASLIGVWQTVPSIFADCYGLLRRLPAAARAESAQNWSKPYRAALAFMVLAALPFTWLGRPLFVIVAFTIIGSLFIPFLAATLLWLNTARRWQGPLPRNRPLTNAVLALILLLFLLVGAVEIHALIARLR